MRIQRNTLGLLAVAILTLAACAGGPGTGGVSGSQVQPAIEAATKVKLTSQALGAGAPSGAAILANTPTIATDRQVVMVVVADTAANAKAVADGLAPSLTSLGATAKTYIGKNVVVLYAVLPGGPDNSAAVDAAVKAL